MMLAPKPAWERDLEITKILLEEVAGGQGISATYSTSKGLVITLQRGRNLFPFTTRCPAALCTPKIAANVISRAGLGDHTMLAAILGVSEEVTIQLDSDSNPRFTASGTLSS